MSRRILASLAFPSLIIAGLLAWQGQYLFAAVFVALFILALRERHRTD